MPGLLPTALAALQLLAFSVPFCAPALARSQSQSKSQAQTDSPQLAHFLPHAQKHAGLLRLDDRSYADLVAGPRDYAALLLMTALQPDLNCQPCRVFDPEYAAFASAYAKQHPTAQPNGTHVLFAQLDYAQGQSTFARLGINVAPMLSYLPPTTDSSPSPSSPSTSPAYDFDVHGLSAPALATWLSRVHAVPVPYKPPINYAALLSPVLTALGLAAAAYAAWPYLRTLLRSPLTWAALSLPFILAMTAGFMWTKIRTPPWMNAHADGSANYWAGGFQNQLGVEVPIVAAAYAFLAGTVLVLALLVPRLSDAPKQRLTIYIWTAILMLSYGLFLSIFRMKQGSYPFHLFF